MRYRSEALATVHEIAHGQQEAGATDRRSMKSFDEMCLSPVEPLSPAQIRSIRLR